MATTEETVAGTGWISDDSSFYGECSHLTLHITSSRHYTKYKCLV